MKKLILIFLIFPNYINAQYSSKTLKEDFDFMYNSEAFHLNDYDLTKDGYKISDVDLNNYLKKI